jgi:hypothetical protein
MTTPSYMAYLIIGGVVLMSFLAPVFVGWDAWFVPLAVLPFAALYALYDRQLARREESGGLGH